MLSGSGCRVIEFVHHGPGQRRRSGKPQVSMHRNCHFFYSLRATVSRYTERVVRTRLCTGVELQAHLSPDFLNDVLLCIDTSGFYLSTLEFAEVGSLHEGEKILLLRGDVHC